MSSVADGLPQEVAAFLSRYINSLEQLEILLYLHSHAPQESSTDELVARVGSDARVVNRHLSYLWAQGLLSSRMGQYYRFNPRTAELGAVVDALARCYKDRRVAVITRIYKRAPDRLQSFSDAFRFRQEDQDG